jgi:hypothetical protein
LNIHISGPPRITNYLRAYSNVTSKKKDDEDQDDTLRVLAAKREKRRQEIRWDLLLS